MLAERAVKTFKSTLKKLNTGSLQSQVNDFLFKYCIMPQMTMGISPAQLMMGRQVSSHLDLLLPNVADKVHRSQNLQKQAHDYHASDRQLQIDSLVLAKNHEQGPPWIPGKILKPSGAVIFLVELTDGTVVCCHIDQLKLNMTNQAQPESEPPASPDVAVTDNIPSSEVTTPELRHSSCIRYLPHVFSRQLLVCTRREGMLYIMYVTIIIIMHT